MTRKIRVGIAGVGNNALALVQGVLIYSRSEMRELVSAGHHGLLFPSIGGYSVSDVEFSSAFDVDERKVGLDLGEAIFAGKNNYPKMLEVAPSLGVTVKAAPVLDGVPEFLAKEVPISQAAAGDKDISKDILRCAKEISETQTEVLLNFLPSGSELATQFFAQVAAEGGAAYVNCTPTPVTHSDKLRRLFEQAGQPVLGDDLESHFGSSLIHRTLIQALEQRGLEIVHSHQINIGGNLDFANLTHRMGAKQKSKMAALGDIRQTDRITILPSGGFVAGLGDRKTGYITIEGKGWLGTPVTIDLKLQVQDSSNAAGVIIDLIRIAATARDKGLSGDVPLSYYFKNPLTKKLSTIEALNRVREFARD